MKSSFDFGFFLSTQIHSQTANGNNKTAASDGVQEVPHLPRHLASTFLNRQSKQDCYPHLPKYPSLKQVLPTPCSRRSLLPATYLQMGLHTQALLSSPVHCH